MKRIVYRRAQLRNLKIIGPYARQPEIRFSGNGTKNTVKSVLFRHNERDKIRNNIYTRPCPKRQLERHDNILIQSGCLEFTVLWRSQVGSMIHSSLMPGVNCVIRSLDGVLFSSVGHLRALHPSVSSGTLNWESDGL